MADRGLKRPGAKLLQPRGYAKRLSPYTNKGVCGDEVKEIVESQESLENKVELLAQAIQQANYVVAHTGAGISTSAGIPDFRGANGIWTRQKRGEPLPDHEKCWNNAVPTLSHMALVGLMNAGKLQSIISQNIDGLHYRSGIPRTRLNELHGNMFMEKCLSCDHEVMRSFDVGGIGLKPTGRRCPRPRCGCRLVDALLDWEDELPEPDFERATKEAEKCRTKWEEEGGAGVVKAGGLALCLGTSMQMRPANELPAEAGRMVIINLQPTQMDDEAWLVMRARLDDIMHRLMSKLHIPIPVYERIETVSISCQHTLRHTRSGATGTCSTVSVLNLTIGESSLMQQSPSGYISTVSLRLRDKTVNLESQPFSHFERQVLSRTCAACPICCKEDSQETIDVSVTVAFEQMPSVSAGAASLPPYLPPPVTRTISLPAHRKSEQVDDFVVKLLRVNYNQLYV